MSRNPLYGLIIGYCIVSSGNRMVSIFQHYEVLHFLTKLSNFFKVFENVCPFLIALNGSL